MINTDPILIKTVINMATFCILGYIGYGAFHGEYTVADIALVWMLLQMITGGLHQTFPLIIQFHQQIVHVKNLRDTLDDAPEIIGYTTGKRFLFHTGNIAIEDITYAYTTEKVFEHFSVAIQ